ncbi:MAG: M15 family metallopeptidase [Treponema sp.]|nr:M15 family metallopeptidase [Treponema sp.]
MPVFKRKLLFLLIIPILIVIIVITGRRTPATVYAEEPDFQVLVSVQEQPPVISRAELIMTSLSDAYPDRIGPAQQRDGDWAFQIRGAWFYYAEGRILPERLRNNFAEYRALGFNSNYQVDLPSWESGAEQRAARTRSYEESRNRTEPRQPQVQPRPVTRRPNYFFEALWNTSTREEASRQQGQVNFLGRRITVHSGLVGIMQEINDIIMAESRSNPEVRSWINSLGSITGWNWRNVASSGNRSFHSYGIAIDILPENLGGLATYWLWTSQHEPLWWNIPYSGRWHPPDMVVKTFESFGFTWGGKWGNYDTMHFEYRPEAFILSNIPMNESRTEILLNRR